MNLETAFGNVLRELRNNKELSQEELANRSGFHRTYVSLLERGLKTPSLNTLWRISQALEIPMNQFVLLVEEEVKKPQPKFKGEKR